MKYPVSKFAALGNWDFTIDENKTSSFLSLVISCFLNYLTELGSVTN